MALLGDLPQASLLAAFLAGLLSFLSPCVLPLVPSYLTYVTGLSVEDLKGAGRREGLRRTVLTNSLLFIAGFSAVFIGFGASASAVGRALAAHQDLLRKAGAVLIILFGLSLVGGLKLPFLMREHRLRWRSRPAGHAGSFLVGAAFAAGWTPCVGPVLGAMLLYAGAAETLWDGVTLLAFYCLGLGLPLFAAALSLDRFLAWAKPFRASLGLIGPLTGLLLILSGVVMYLDRLSSLTAFFERYGIGSYFGADGG